MNSELEVEDTLVGELTENISLIGNLVSSSALTGLMQTTSDLVGSVKLNETTYYEVANEYGNTVYIE